MVTSVINRVFEETGSVEDRLLRPATEDTISPSVCAPGAADWTADSDEDRPALAARLERQKAKLSSDDLRNLAACRGSLST